jgi:hypothetical protein
LEGKIEDVKGKVFRERGRGGKQNGCRGGSSLPPAVDRNADVAGGCFSGLPRRFAVRNNVFNRAINSTCSAEIAL